MIAEVEEVPYPPSSCNYKAHRPKYGKKPTHTYNPILSSPTQVQLCQAHNIQWTDFWEASEGKGDFNPFMLPALQDGPPWTFNSDSAGASLRRERGWGAASGGYRIWRALLLPDPLPPSVFPLHICPPLCPVCPLPAPFCSSFAFPVFLPTPAGGQHSLCVHGKASMLLECPLWLLQLPPVEHVFCWWLGPIGLGHKSI